MKGILYKSPVKYQIQCQDKNGNVEWYDLHRDEILSKNILDEVNIKGAVEVGFEREWDSALDCFVATLCPLLETKLEIQSEFTCKMEDCPHCAYEEQQMYEENLEKEAAVDFAKWLAKDWMSIWVVDKWMWENVTILPTNDESEWKGYYTEEQLYELYLKS
jgi:hypothetical protein